MKKHFVSALVAIVISCCAYQSVQAQQDPIYSQYMFNGMVINPAYPSMDQSSSITAVGRNQWVGIEGAPQTLSFSFYTPLKATNTSVGVSLMSEKITVNSQTGLNFHISQRVKLDDKLYVALGLKGGMSQYRENNSRLNSTDPAFAQNMNYWKTDVGFGFMIFSENFYVGLSSPAFQSFDLGKKAEKVKPKSHYYLQAGYLAKINDQVKLKPNLLLRVVEGAGLQADVNVNVLLKDLVWLGASWRTEKTITGLVQVQVNKNFQVGYSYDTPTSSNLKGAQAASHEVMLNYRFVWKKWKEVAPRYF